MMVRLAAQSSLSLVPAALRVQMLMLLTRFYGENRVIAYQARTTARSVAGGGGGGGGGNAGRIDDLMGRSRAAYYSHCIALLQCIVDP